MRRPHWQPSSLTVARVHVGGYMEAQWLNVLERRHAEVLYLLGQNTTRRRNMNQNIKGAFQKAKGSMKNALGKMTGHKKMQAEGKWDRAKGEMNKKASGVMDAAKHATKR